MKSVRPPAPFKKLNAHPGGSLTLDTSGKVLVLPSGNADVLPLFNEYVLSSNRLTDDFGGLTGAGSPDYLPGTLYTPTDGVYLTDVAGNNSTKTLTTGKLKELEYLTVDPVAHTITQEFIVANTSESNNPTVISDGSSTAGWSTIGNCTLTTENGKLKIVGTSDSTGGLRIFRSLTLGAQSLIRFTITCNTDKNMYVLIYQNPAAYEWRGNKFPIPANTETTFVLSVNAPAWKSDTINWNNSINLYIGTDQADSSEITFYIDDITVDTAKSAYVELQTPDLLADSSLTIQAHNGTAYAPIGTYKLDSTYAAVGTPTSANWVLNDNTKLDDIYGTGLGRAVFPKNVSGATVNGSTGTMVYSGNQGTQNRIGLMVQLPPSDGGRTNFNKIRLKTVLSYAPDSHGNYSTSYNFADSTNASFGLQNLIKPWLALYSPESNEIDFYLYTHRPKNLEFKRDETGVIHELVLYPGNGLIYHGRITYAGLTTDADSNLIPNCLEASIEGSVTKFLEAYDFSSWLLTTSEGDFLTTTDGWTLEVV